MLIKKNNAMLGLRTAIYKVSELDKAKAWYAKVFNTEPYFDEVFYVGFNIGGYELGLQTEEEENAGEEKNPNIIVYWGVVDIQKEFDRLIAFGARVHEAPANVGGELMVATVFDPWGNVLGMIYNPYFGMSEEGE
jgi:predicted enzyme related to lactoylglutathione lyase